MGWVVYEQATGRAVKYYRKIGPAKAAVTKQRRMVESGARIASSWGRDVTWIYCSYADYEGVLMGMQEPERKMWAFCRG